MTNARARLSRLLAEFGRMTGAVLPSAMSIEAPTRLVAEWNGVTFELRHGGDDDDALLVRCRLGALQEATAIPAMKRLLEIQAELTRDERALLSLDPITGEACVTQALSLESATTDELGSTLHVMMQRAGEWKAAQFLNLA
jgi:hypothetical protein